MKLKLTMAALALAAAMGFSGGAQAEGCKVVVFWDANFSGERMFSDHDVSWVGNHWNDQISSIKVISGVWKFYFDINYGGESMRLRPGVYPFVGPHWNDQISSFRCVRPTDRY
jgi:hypothetical protein